MGSETLPFGDWLRAMLNQKGWDQADLVRESDLSSGLVSNYLNGRRKPGSGSCRKIARALGLHPDMVLMRAGHLDQDSRRYSEAELRVRQHDLKRELQSVRGQIDRIVRMIDEAERRDGTVIEDGG